MCLSVRREASRRLKKDGDVVFRSSVYVDSSEMEARSEAMVCESRGTSFATWGFVVAMTDPFLPTSVPKIVTRGSRTEVILKIAPFPTGVLSVETRAAWLLIEMVLPEDWNVRGMPSMLMMDLLT